MPYMIIATQFMAIVAAIIPTKIIPKVLLRSGDISGSMNLNVPTKSMIKSSSFIITRQVDNIDE